MTNIIKFPLVDSQSDKNTPVIQAKRSGFAMKAVLVTFWRALLRTVWVVTVLIWPLLKWAISIYIFSCSCRWLGVGISLVRMLVGLSFLISLALWPLIISFPFLNLKGYE